MLWQFKNVRFPLKLNHYHAYYHAYYYHAFHKYQSSDLYHSRIGWLTDSGIFLFEKISDQQ